MTEGAPAAIEVVLIIKTKVYRSLNMGVLQGGRAIPTQFAFGMLTRHALKTAKHLQFISFFALGHPLGSWKSLKNDVFIHLFELCRHKEASRELWSHLGDEKKV